MWEQEGLEHSTKLGKAAKRLQKAIIKQNRRVYVWGWKSFPFVCTEVLGVTVSMGWGGWQYCAKHYRLRVSL